MTLSYHKHHSGQDLGTQAAGHIILSSLALSMALAASSSYPILEKGSRGQVDKAPSLSCLSSASSGYELGATATALQLFLALSPEALSTPQQGPRSSQPLA